MSANQLFNEFFDLVAAENKIEFKEEWNNGTGYLDGAVDDKDINFDKDGCAVTVDNYGRKVIILRTPLDNIVVFERYSSGNWKSTPIVANCHHGFYDLGLVEHGALDEYRLRNIVGWSKESHIGQKLSRVFQAMKLRENNQAAAE